ncbi:MAG: pyruvate dehydrogenase complex dihydrolipoamide acetyltransferase [Pseudomonadota bacterium]
MPIEILMPALSPTMTEGNLAKWLKKEGEKVEAGDVIAEIETDKATMEVEAVDEGVLAKILVAQGTENVAVNKLIAVLSEENDDQDEINNFISKFSGDASANDQGSDAATAADNASASSSETVNNNEPTSDAGSSLNAGTQEQARIKASPLARRIASQNSIDLTNIQGSGPHGRVIKIDVEDAIKNGVTSSVSGAVGNNSNAAANNINNNLFRNPEEFVKQPNNNMRKVIAKRLLESKQTVPHFYLNIDCQLDKLLSLRKEMNDAAVKAAGKDEKPSYKISVNDFIIKASALALRDVPEANASWTDEAILLYNNVDISVAVAIDGGLITPIVKNADKKNLTIISNEMKDLAQRARLNKLAPEEFQGGGFSISNLGMYGIKRFNAIINPPQSAILAIGAGDKRPVFDDNGNVSAAMVMDATLSSDHRVVDGAVGAEFLAAFKRYVENPITMLI